MSRDLHGLHDFVPFHVSISFVLLLSEISDVITKS